MRMSSGRSSGASCRVCRLVSSVASGTSVTAPYRSTLRPAGRISRTTRVAVQGAVAAKAHLRLHRPLLVHQLDRGRNAGLHLEDRGRAGLRAVHEFASRPYLTRIRE
jgi:hypothetical protein